MNSHLFFRVLCVPLIAGSVFAQAGQGPAAAVRRLNAQLEGIGLSESRTAAIASGLLRSRAAEFRQLMTIDPAAAIELALPEDTAGRLRQLAPDAVESRGEWSGQLETLVEDDFARRTSRIVHHLQTTGTEYDIYFAGQPPKAGCGDRLAVAGVSLGNVIAARIETFEPAALACSTTGDQKVAVLMVDFPGNPLPVTSQYLRSLFFDTTGDTLNALWRQFSFNRAWASGDVFGPLTLSRSYTCNESGELRKAAIAAFDPAVNFQDYTRIFIIVPPSANCGLGSIGCGLVMSQDGTSLASTAWISMPSSTPFNRNTCVVVHEGGHNLGLHHASSAQFGTAPLGPLDSNGTHDEYGDVYSLMGVCFTYGGSPLLGHYAAPHKEQLGWLLPSNIRTVEASGTFDIKTYETLTSGVQALKIRRGSSNKWLWMENRQPVGSDASFTAFSAQPFSGALVHYEDPDATHDGNETFINYTRLLDFTAARTPGNFDDPAFEAGSSWTDSATSLSLTVTSATPAALTVTVSYADCVSISPSNRTHSSTAVAGQTVSVTASAGCTWTAVSTAPWIQVTSGGGTGSGTVLYSVSANPGPGSRNGTITIGTQTFTVTQTAPPLPCVFTVGAQGTTLAPGGGSGGIDVTTEGNCSWTALSQSPWIGIGSGGGTGTGTVTFSAGPNPSPTLARTGSLLVGGQVVQVLQRASSPSTGFQDVGPDDMFADMITLLKETGITQGCSQNPPRYCPGDSVTRGQMAAFLVRGIVGDTFSYSSTPYFQDVPPTHIFFRYVQKLKELGVTVGCTQVTYCPEDPVTRGQMAAFLVRGRLGIQAGAPFSYLPTPYFTDAPAGALFFEYIQKLRELGITAGCTPTLYCPNDPTTRGQMAVFLIRAFRTP